jgi:ankyrin repeat protein
MVEELLEAGTNIDDQDNIGQTPLHRAVHGAQEEAVTMLLQAGASVGARDKVGRKPLRYAVSKDSVALGTILLKHGADPDAKGLWSDTPRLEAGRRDLGLEEVIERGEVLRQAGDDRAEMEFPLLR